jgi:O-antigen/teichoic acid export membrane protein
MTNFLLSLVVARSVSSEEFGAFAVAFAVFTIAMGISRAFGTDPLTIRFSAVSEDEWRHATGKATGTALVVGCVGGIAVLAVAGLLSGPLRSNLAAVALCLPALMLQDAWRFAFFAKGRPSWATVNDAVWAAALLGAFVLLLVGDVDSAWPFVAGWGAASLVAALVGVAQAQTWPSLAAVRGWVSGNRRLSPSLFGDYAVSTGVRQVVLFGMGALAGLDAVGGFRGATIMFGPVQVVTMGMATLALPEGARLLPRSARTMVLGMAAISLVGAGVAGAWGLAVWLGTPRSLGLELLGDTWDLTRPVLPATAVLIAATAAASGAISGLRVLERARAGFVIRLAAAPFMLGGGLAGAWLGGASGAMWGLAVPMVVSAAAWWRSLLGAASEIDAERSTADAGVVEPSSP